MSGVAAMMLEYDLDAGALYIRLADGDVARTRQVDDNTLIDMDGAGNVLGVEVVSARHPWAIAEVLRMDGISAAAKAQMLGYFVPSSMPAMSVG
jgi:uncharacterized protein YuzE